MLIVETKGKDERKRDEKCKQNTQYEESFWQRRADDVIARAEETCEKKYCGRAQTNDRPRLPWSTEITSHSTGEAIISAAAIESAVSSQR